MSIQNITLNKETSLSSQNRILNKETSLSSQNITLSKETSLSSQNITLSKKKTTGVAANNNITGSEADLILFQVTGSSGSGLNGAIEVFGGEAGLIIANPNGISCNGCGFINTNKVDLVTGTANFSGDDLTGFSIDGSSTLNVSGSGFLSDAVADELNLVSRNINTVAQAKANTTLRFLAGNETYDHTTNIITSNATETSGPHSIWISGDLEANYIELISTEISSGGIYGIVNHGEDISADRLKIDSNGLFRNQNDGTNVGNINISGLLDHYKCREINYFPS